MMYYVLKFANQRILMTMFAFLKQNVSLFQLVGIKLTKVIGAGKYLLGNNITPKNKLLDMFKFFRPVGIEAINMVNSNEVVYQKGRSGTSILEKKTKRCL